MSSSGTLPVVVGRWKCRIGTAALAAAMMLWQFAFAINEIIGARVAYEIGLALLGVSVAAVGRLSRKALTAVLIGALICGWVVLQAESGVSLASGWVESLALYSVLPGMVLLIDVRRINWRVVSWSVVLTVLPAALGLVCQSAGLTGVVFREEMTTTTGETLTRYNSIYGAALLFGMCGFAQFVSSLKLLRTSNRWQRPILVAFAVLAFTCMLFSYARRAYLSCAVAVLLTFLFGSRGKRRSKAAAVLFGVTLIAAAVLAGSSIQSRLASSVNFSDDEANVLRAAKWAMALRFVEERPILGGGPGVLSAVGKTKDEIGSACEAEVAEMLYLTIVCDLGILIGGLVIVLVIRYSCDRVRRSEDQRLVTVPMLVEGIAGTAIQNPYLALLFLVSLSNSREERRLASEDVRSGNRSVAALRNSLGSRLRRRS